MAEDDPSLEDVEREAGNRARLAAARAGILAEVGAYSTADLAAVGHDVDRLLHERKIFAVRHDSAWHYPKYQFDQNLAPYGEVAEVLAALGDKARPWDVCGWFMEPNETLAGSSPITVWATDRSKVVVAAQHAHWFARD